MTGSRAKENDPAAAHEARAAELAASGRVEEAIASYRASIDADPTRARSWNNLGELYGRIGQLENAAAAFKNALQCDPGHITAGVNLGLCCVSLGDYRRAATLFADVLAADPRNGDALMYLGSCRNALGNYQGAIESFETLLGMQPDNALAMTYLGAAQLHLGRHFDAEASFRRALGIRPDLADAQCNLGRLLLASGNTNEARACLETAIRLQADHQIALCGLAMIDENSGQASRGLARLLPIHERGDAVPDVAITIARLYRAIGDHDASLKILNELTSSPSLPRESRLQAQFALGRSLDGLGRYEEAWARFESANRMKNAQYNRISVEQAIRRVMAFSSEEVCASLPASTVTSKRPVFLVGLPRSGKSLLESMLATHPAVAARGELTRLGEISTRISADGLAYPEALAAMDVAQLEVFAREYLAASDSPEGAAERTIDTLPGNFLHVALIRSMLPGASVIWCRRDLRDTALYCYFKNFSGESHSYTFSLDDLAHYFSWFNRLMTHWQSRYPGFLHIVDYESLVDEPRQVLTRVFEFLNLEPGLASEPPALTKSEIGRYQQYRRWIEPLPRELAGEPGED